MLLPFCYLLTSNCLSLPLIHPLHIWLGFSLTCSPFETNHPAFHFILFPDSSIDHSCFDSETTHKMYPRAKVREQKQNNHLSLQNDSPPMALLRVLESLSSFDKEARNSASTSSSKISKSGVRNLTAVTPSSKGVRKNEKNAGQDEKQGGRACSVPRPRAVLSSPDNDEMIGDRNKLISQSRSIPREHGLKQNRHVQIKEIPIHGKEGSPPRMRKREVPNANSRLKQRNYSGPPHLGEKPCPRKQIGKSIGI